MAQLLSTSIAAPGFYGLNTQESSITLSSGYALEATNCVIDKYGRLGSRQGWIDRTLADTEVNIKGIHEFTNNSGDSTYLSWGDNKIYTGIDTLTERTPVTNATITASNWQGVTLSNHAYLFQRGHDPLVQEVGGPVQRVRDHHHASGVAPQANCVLSAYGRLWAADIIGDNHTVHFSDLVTTNGGGGRWGGVGASGLLDIAQVWTKGGDSIVALGAFNGFLIIFCKNCIVVYGDTDSNNNYLTPSTLRLVEVIEGVGCIARDSVQNTGTDLLFLSNSGVRSLSRVIQEKSTPIGDISVNVRDELADILATEPADNIKSVYSEKHAFYLLSFPTSEAVYCFDMRGKLENGAARTTRWTGMTHRGMLDTKDGRLLFGQSTGIAEYGSYHDNNVSYRMIYYTNYFDFDQPTTTKILKAIGITLIGGSGQAFTIKAGIDYSDEYRSYNASVKQTTIYEYGGYEDDDITLSDFSPTNPTEYNVGEFSGGGSTDRIKMSIGGSGAVVQLGFETEVSGDEVSIQKFDLYIKQGRIT